MQLSLSEKSQTSTCTRNNRRFTAEAGVVIMTDPLKSFQLQQDKRKVNGHSFVGLFHHYCAHLLVV